MLRRKWIRVALCLAAASIGVGLVTPVLAQRYPPFPIDGGTSGTSGAADSGNTAPRSTSGSGSEFFNPGGSAGSNNTNGTNDDGTNASSASQTSNSVDEPSCDLASCLRFAGQVGQTFVLNRVQELGELRVGAVSGCCQSFARVDVYMESKRVFLGTVRANEDGSYFGVFKVPSSITAGQHHIIADIEGCGELRAPIEVVDAGASVLGTSTRNTSGSSDTSGSGVLPRTGNDFMRVIMWALILIGLGSMLIVATRRFSPAHAHAGRGRARGTVAALPPPEVPFIDTSRFVPYRSASGQHIAAAGPGARTPRARPTPTTRRARTTSAWDEAPKNESPS